MIANALVWIGEHAIAVSALGIAAIAIGLIIYAAHDIPAPPIEEDEHARSKFIG
jgi:hypothetical protein